MSSPTHYFSELETAVRLEINGYRPTEFSQEQQHLAWFEQIRHADCIIVGGGGLLGSEFFLRGLNTVFELRKPQAKVVLWGAGHNEWRVSDWRNISYKIDFSRLPFNLVGVRDAGQIGEWVPCASCMHTIFDAPAISAAHDVVLYVNNDTYTLLDQASRLPTGIPCMTNVESFESIINFLGSGELILTDSYHGAYWATLLGRRVVAFPSSSKFYGFRHAIPLCAPEDWARFSRLAISYPNALDECRTANQIFAMKASQMLRRD